jgi:hypothetical protein
MPEFLEKVEVRGGRARLADKRRLVAAGWLVGLDINSRSLNSLPGLNHTWFSVRTKKR